MQIAEQYKIITELGNQKIRKFGRVFLVENRSTGQQFVMKVFKIEDGNELLAERIRNEALFTFDSKGLPRVIEYLETKGEIFLILEFKQGETLDEFWKKVKHKERIKTLRTVLEAMVPLFEHLKMSGIVHCDIKPSNLIIRNFDNKLEVNLIDFGLAYNMKQDPDDRKILFPLGFAAPELILNKMECVDHSTDLYALGITVWKLFTGKLPLTHPNPSIFTNLQIVHPIPESNEIPKKLFNVLSKMCYKYPFETSPNRLDTAQVILKLNEAKKQRYKTLPEILQDLQDLNDKKGWFSKVLS